MLDMIFKKLKRKGKRRSSTLTGYRHGDIGAYSGEGSSPIAWKAMDHEFNVLHNEKFLKGVAHYLGVPPASWPEVLDRFREEQGNRKGIWLCRNLNDVKKYDNLGPLKSYHYNTGEIMCDKGPEGIYVLIGPPPVGIHDDDEDETVLKEDDKPVLEDKEPGSESAAPAPKPRRKRGLWPTGLGGMQ